VIELGSGIPSGYAGKLFRDAGAEVVKVEPPGGDPLRRWSATGADLEGRTGALFSFLTAGKQSILGSIDDPQIGALVAGADLVIEDGAVDIDALRDDAPRLVILSITPFGRTGPWSTRPATDFIVQAECGSIAARGAPDSPPVQAGARTSEWAAGLYGASAALAAVLGVRDGADGVVIDASWMEAMTIATNLFADPLWSLMTALMGVEPSGPARSVETPSIYPSADGWIGFNTNGPQHAEAFLHLIERPDLIEAGYVMASTRTANRHEFDEWVRAFTTRFTSAEILDRAAELRVPTVRVNDGATVLLEEHLMARDFFAPSADGGLVAPRPHYRIAGERPPAAGPVPPLGADQPRARVADRRSEVTHRRPLEGLKVLDVTCWWAGPSNTQILAAMGADVIHVESIAHADPMRYAAAVMFLDRDQWWELSSFYLGINTNKRGITLDLNAPDGVALLERLVGWSDIVVENYTPRVMPKFGLGWERIHELNPRAVMVRQPAFPRRAVGRPRCGDSQRARRPLQRDRSECHRYPRGRDVDGVRFVLARDPSDPARQDERLAQTRGRADPHRRATRGRRDRSRIPAGARRLDLVLRFDRLLLPRDPQHLQDDRRTGPLGARSLPRPRRSAPGRRGRNRPAAQRTALARTRTSGIRTRWKALANRAARLRCRGRRGADAPNGTPSLARRLAGGSGFDRPRGADRRRRRHLGASRGSRSRESNNSGIRWSHRDRRTTERTARRRFGIVVRRGFDVAPPVDRKTECPIVGNRDGSAPGRQPNLSRHRYQGPGHFGDSGGIAAGPAYA